jgi:hypothetical protein
MNIKDLTDLYVWIRQNNQTTPDDVIDFMYKSAKEKLEKINEERDCSNCTGNGNQCVCPSQCTGCGSNGEFKNYKNVKDLSIHS